MAGGGGGKTASSTSNTSSPFAPYLAQDGSQLFNLAKPVISNLSSQATSALQTGGVNAQIPSINASLDSSRRSASTSDTNLRQSLAKSGLGGTSFGNAILGEQEGTTSQNIAAIPGTAANSFLGMAAPAVIQEGNAGLGALGTAGSLDTATAGTQTASFWDTFMQGVQLAATGKSGSSGSSGGGGGSSGGSGSAAKGLSSLFAA